MDRYNGKISFHYEIYYQNLIYIWHETPTQLIPGSNTIR